MQDVGVLSLLTVTFYIEWLRSWAQRVRRERFPYHLAISVDGVTRLEGWLDAAANEAWILAACLCNTWNLSDELSDIGCADRHGDSVWIVTDDASTHTIAVTASPPVTWRPRHLLAQAVARVLPASVGTGNWQYEVKP